MRIYSHGLVESGRLLPSGPVEGPLNRPNGRRRTRFPIPDFRFPVSEANK